MAGYNTIRGLRVKYLSADPANPENGQVWYNSTTGNLRVDGMVLAGSWSSGGALPTATNNGGASGSGTQTASIYFGGHNGSTYLNTSQTYNGTSWTGQPTMSYAKGSQGSAGTQTAAIGFAGYSNTTGPAGPYGSWISTESWNGSTWTTSGDINSNRYSGTGIGLQTAALYAGGFLSGQPAANGSRTEVESYNGSAWTAVSALSQRRQALASSGTQTAALALGGWISPGSITAVAESYNGSSWTSGTSMGTAKYGLGSCGTQTAALVFGGALPAKTGATEEYDGSSWTTINSLATARSSLSGSGTTTAALAIGGNTGSITAVTEAFTGPSTQIKNITTS